MGSVLQLETLDDREREMLTANTATASAPLLFALMRRRLRQAALSGPKKNNGGFPQPDAASTNRLNDRAELPQHGADVLPRAG